MASKYKFRRFWRIPEMWNNFRQMSTVMISTSNFPFCREVSISVSGFEIKCVLDINKIYANSTVQIHILKLKNRIYNIWWGNQCYFLDNTSTIGLCYFLAKNQMTGSWIRLGIKDFGYIALKMWNLTGGVRFNGCMITRVAFKMENNRCGCKLHVGIRNEHWEKKGCQCDSAG